MVFQSKVCCGDSLLCSSVRSNKGPSIEARTLPSPGSLTEGLTILTTLVAHHYSTYYGILLLLVTYSIYCSYILNIYKTQPLRLFSLIVRHPPSIFLSRPAHAWYHPKPADNINSHKIARAVKYRFQAGRHTNEQTILVTPEGTESSFIRPR